MQSSGRDEQSLCHIAVVENFWISTNHGPAIEAKKKRKNWHVRLSCAWLHAGKKMVAHTFHLSLDNANHFKNNNCWDSENFVKMVTWDHTSSLH